MLKRTFFFLVLVSFLLWIISLAQVHAQGINLDSVSSAALSAANTSLTFSHTVGSSGTNRLLVVGVSVRHDNSTYTIGVTYNGVAMTEGGTSSRNEALCKIFYLAAPATGTNNVVVTLSKSLMFGAGAISFTGVNQTTPVSTFAGATGDSTTPSVNVANVFESQVVIDTVATGDVQTDTLTVGTGQTQQWNTKTTVGGADKDTFVAGSTESGPDGGGTVTMSWTLSVAEKWAIGAVAIIPQYMVVLSLTPTKDTWLSATSATTNYGNSTTFSVEGENNRRKRGLLQFDLSSVPTGVTFQSVKLLLEWVSGEVVADDPVGVYALTRSWVEGNGTSGSGATWNTYDGTNKWTTAGGDFDATPVATSTITNATGQKSWDVKTLVQDWISGTRTNYGMLLKRNPEADGNMPRHDFSSREGTVPPKLQIVYTYTPTAVKLESFTASMHEAGVLLKWWTGYEVDNLGFHVYREENGELVRLTPEPVAGSALLAGRGIRLGAGHSYFWWDMSLLSPQPSYLGTVQYWLKDIDLNGKETMHGPVTPVVSGEPLPRKFRPELLSELGMRLEERYRHYWKVQELKEKLERKRSTPA